MNKTTIENEISQGVNRAGEAIRDTAGKVQNVAQTAADAMHNVRQGVGDAASYVRHKADDVTTAVGGALENTGHYLREDGIRNLTTDLTNLVRRNPVPALLAGIAAGYLLACAMNGRGSMSGRGEFHA